MKRYIKNNTPKSERSKAIAKLDRVFSDYIRQRDSKNGMFRCISCGQIKSYEQADCGHYINRRHIATRFDEVNCNAQCRSCNRFKEGNIQGYRRGLIHKYGEESVLLLESRQNNICHLTIPEIDILVKYYKEKILDIKNTPF